MCPTRRLPHPTAWIGLALGLALTLAGCSFDTKTDPLVGPTGKVPPSAAADLDDGGPAAAPC